MLCLIAGNREEAERWARGQELKPEEWFYPEDFNDLQTRHNFHVIVVGSAGQNVSFTYFNRLFKTAKFRGYLK